MATSRLRWPKREGKVNKRVKCNGFDRKDETCRTCDHRKLHIPTIVGGFLCTTWEVCGTDSRPDRKVRCCQQKKGGK